MEIMILKFFFINQNGIVSFSLLTHVTCLSWGLIYINTHTLLLPINIEQKLILPSFLRIMRLRANGTRSISNSTTKTNDANEMLSVLGRMADAQQKKMEALQVGVIVDLDRVVALKEQHPKIIYE